MPTGEPADSRDSPHPGSRGRNSATLLCWRRPQQCNPTLLEEGNCVDYTPMATWLARCRSCPDLERPGYCPEGHSERGGRLGARVLESQAGWNVRCVCLLATAGTNNWPRARVPAQGHGSDRDTAPRVAANGRSSRGPSPGKVGRLNLAPESRSDGADRIKNLKNRALQDDYLPT